MNDNLITYSRNIVAFFTRIFYAFLCFLHVSLWHDLPTQTIWMNGDVAVAPLVFFRPFSVGFSFIRVCLEFAFTFLHTASHTHDLLFYDPFLPSQTIWMNAWIWVARLVFFGFNFIARTYLQPHYRNGVFGNVYLSAGRH